MADRRYALLGHEHENISTDWTFLDDVKLHFGTDQDVDIDFDSSLSALDIVLATGMKLNVREGTQVKFQIAHDNSRVEIRDGYTFRIRDSGDNDWLDMVHDGTDFDFIFNQTRHFSIDAADAMTGDVQITPDVHLINSSKLRLRGNVSTEHVEMYNDGSNVFHVTGTNTANWLFENMNVQVRDGKALSFFHTDNVAAASLTMGTNTLTLGNVSGLSFFNIGATTQILSGKSLVVLDSGNTDTFKITHTGTDVSFDHTNTTDWNISNISGFVWIRDGAGLRISDSTDVDKVEMSHDGTDFNITSTNTADLDITGHSGTIRVPAGSGIGVIGIAGGLNMTRITLADDATGTVALGSTQTFLIMVTSFNRTAAFAAFSTSQQAWSTIAAQGSLVQLGTSTNPGVDGSVNVWKSTTSQLSIKNRLGSTRNFFLYHLTI